MSSSAAVSSDNTSSFKVPANLGEFNQVLNGLGLVPIPLSVMTVLKAREPRQRVLDALARATLGDLNAKTYLNRILREAREASGQAIGDGATTTASKPSTRALAQSGERPALRVVESTPLPRASTAATPVKTAPPSPDLSNQPKPAETAAPRRKEERPRLNCHVYGQSAALCFEADQTRAGEPTVALDAALAKGQKQKDNERAFDWASKIRLQLTRTELPVVLGVFLHILPGCEFKYHGEHRDKGFSVANQGDSFLVRVFAKEQPPRVVPIGPEDAVRVAALLMQQYRFSLGEWLSGTDIMLLLKAVLPMKARERVHADGNGR